MREQLELWLGVQEVIAPSEYERQTAKEWIEYIRTHELGGGES